jgi:uncharacterized protein
LRNPTSPTTISLREIPPEGLHRDYDLPGPFVADALEGTEVDASASTIRAALDLFRTGHEVLVRGSLDGELTAVCSRCAGVARVALSSPIEVVFLPRGAEASAAERDDAADQPDVLHYDNEEIDIAETLREELLLALPIAPLCTEACKGLCARCGKDLNEGPCDCPEEPKDDRWSALREVARNLKAD